MVSIHVTHVAGGDNGLKNGDLGGGDGGAGGDEGDAGEGRGELAAGRPAGAVVPEVEEDRRQREPGGAPATAAGQPLLLFEIQVRTTFFLTSGCCFYIFFKPFENHFLAEI